MGFLWPSCLYILFVPGCCGPGRVFHFAAAVVAIARRRVELVRL